MKWTGCRACLSARVEPFLDLGELPLAGGFLQDEVEIASERSFPLAVHVCTDCGLVQNVLPIAPEILFKQYFFASTTIGPLVQHFKEYADFISGTVGARTVVEFGCNDGILLEQLRAHGVVAVGIDYAENITTIARSKGLDALTGAFDLHAAGAIRARIGAVDFVTGSNCFAHNHEPQVILSAARDILRPSGLLGLEVMYAGDLLEKLQWDTLYHEHLMVFSLGTLSVLLERHGFRVIDVFRIPMHAGSLRVLASADPGHVPHARVAALAAEEARRGLNTPAAWHSFAEKVRRVIHVVETTMAELAVRRRVWAYGASGRASLWLSACRMHYVERVVDASPLRAGTLMPGTHQRVVLPSEMRMTPPDYTFVTAWNYLDVIRAKERWYSGTWITPLPRFEFF
jgi:novobiocin biosynthesis protein NovU/D-mycarose 3-C-methyltransferase